MFGSIRRHQRWLWLIALPFVIVSFVIYFSPTGQSPFGGGAGSGFDYGSINGRKITKQEFDDARRELAVLVFLRSGEWPRTESDFSRIGINPMREALNRILVRELLKAHHVEVAPESVAAWITRFFRRGEDQPFDIRIYQDFLQRVIQNGGTEADVERFVRLEAGRQHLVAVFGTPGQLVTPAEAEAAYRRENDLMITEAVTFPASNFLAQARITAEALGDYYTNNAASYRQAERRSASYVFFPASNYLAAAETRMAGLTNFQQDLEIQYLRQGATNFTDEATGRVLTQPEAIEKMRGEVRTQFSLFEARQDAAKLINAAFALYDENQPQNNQAAFLTAAAASGLTVRTTEPFDMDSRPEGLDVPEQFTTGVFQLTGARPLVSTPIITEAGVYVVGLGQVVPNRLRPFEEVIADVTDDFRQDEARRLAREAGMAFSASLTNAANEGKKFSEIAAAAGLAAVPLPPVSLGSLLLPNQENLPPLRLIQQVGFSLKPGESSQYVPVGDYGVILHLVERRPVEEAVMRAGLPEFVKRIQEQRQSQTFSDWASRRARELKLVPPPGTDS